MVSVQREEPMEVQRILTEELETLLDDVAPAEADTAALYVEYPDRYTEQARREQVFGVPGGAEILLFGPVLLRFVLALLVDFLGEARKKGLERLASSTLDYLRRKFRGAPLPALPSDATSRKQDTVLAISTALIKAGWDAGRAGDAAERVWATGLRTGQRLVSEEVPA